MQKLSLSLVSALVFLFSYSLEIAAKPLHPLDSLDKKELVTALSIIKKAPQWASTMMFPYLLLKEPPKKEVLAFKAGQKFRREAMAVLYDRQAAKTFEVTVDLNALKISEWKEIKGLQPSVMLSEFDAVPPIVKADPRFKVAMERRGVKNLDDITVDVWSYGSPDSEHSEKTRLLRAITYFKGKNKNFYARPIDGLTFIVNMNEKKVEKVIDTDVYPIPPQASDFDESAIGEKRERLKPMKIVQAQGPSYTVKGNEVRWQNWSFHFTMHPREGLVLHLVKYKDHGKERSVMYRGSLSEMMVPYGHNNEHWTYRAAFDEGEYGIGRYSGSLEKGTDVPENAQLFDALFVDDFGKPYTTKNAVAIYERDGGLLWKHFDMYNGGNYSRRGRDLVISFITTVSNYDYGLNWIFHQDGSLELEAQLTGIMLTKNSNLTTMNGHDHKNVDPDMQFGHLVAPNVVAPHHQHFFNFRLDLDVDGEKNYVSELGTYAIPAGSENPKFNAFKMEEAPIKMETHRELDYASQRKWKIYNPDVKNVLGYPASYILIPGSNASPYLLDQSVLLKRGGFVKHPVWFTQENDNELYAAGTYPTQRSSSDGLPEWIKQSRSLENNDVVLWYNFCVTHAPRPEEWPIMTTLRTGFTLIPAGFFDRNPAMDVAK